MSMMPQGAIPYSSSSSFPLQFVFIPARRLDFPVLGYRFSVFGGGLFTPDRYPSLLAPPFGRVPF